MSDDQANARQPHELDRSIELVRAAYDEAMKKAGLLLGKRVEISSVAERLILEALSNEDQQAE